MRPTLNKLKEESHILSLALQLDFLIQIFSAPGKKLVFAFFTFMVRVSVCYIATNLNKSDRVKIVLWLRWEILMNDGPRIALHWAILTFSVCFYPTLLSFTNVINHYGFSHNCTMSIIQANKALWTILPNEKYDIN